MSGGWNSEHLSRAYAAVEAELKVQVELADSDKIAALKSALDAIERADCELAWSLAA